MLIIDLSSIINVHQIKPTRKLLFVNDLRLINSVVTTGAAHAFSLDMDEPACSSIPEPMRRWVESQVKLGKYGNTSEYIRDLIRQDQKQRSQDELEELLLEGLKGPNSAMTRKDWDAIRAEVTRRLTHGGVVSGGARRKKEPAGKR